MRGQRSHRAQNPGKFKATRKQLKSGAGGQPEQVTKKELKQGHLSHDRQAPFVRQAAHCFPGAPPKDFRGFCEFWSQRTPEKGRFRLRGGPRVTHSTMSKETIGKNGGFSASSIGHILGAQTRPQEVGGAQ